MRRILEFIIIFGMGLSAHAESFNLDGTPFQPATNVEIVWTVTVTNLPKDLWAYKVVPQTFSMAALSNLLMLSHLASKNLTKPTGMDIPDNRFVRYVIQNQNGRQLHTLNIAPTLGWINYQNNSGDYKDKIEPAPSEDNVKDLAFDILFQAGIDRSQVLPIPKNYATSTRQVGDDPEVVSERSVFLVRKIDGINERGFCFTANFGTHNGEPRLLSFDLNWRNLSPHESRRVATTDEMSDFIRSGKSSIPQQGIDLDALKHAKKLTVTTFFPLYYNKLGFNKVEYEYPYAVMDIVADTGDNNTISFSLNCPILSTK